MDVDEGADEAPVVPDAVEVAGSPGSGDMLGAWDGDTSGWLAGSPAEGAPGADVCPAAGRMSYSAWPGATSW